METSPTHTFKTLFPKYVELARSENFKTNDNIESFIKNQLPARIQMVRKMQFTFNSFLNQYTNLIVKRPQMVNLSYSLASRATELIEKYFKEYELKYQGANKETLNTTFQDTNPKRLREIFRDSLSSNEALIKQKYIENFSLPRDQQQKIAEVLYTLLQIYHFIKMDLVTYASKFCTLDQSTYNQVFNTNSPRLDLDSLSSSIVLPETFIQALNVTVNKRCRPFIDKRDFFTSKIREVLKQNESKAQPNFVIFLDSLMSRQKHRLTKLAIPKIQGFMRNCEISEEKECKQISNEVDSLKQKFIQIKNNAFYIDIIRGSFNEKYKMQLNKLQNLYYLNNLQMYLQTIYEFIEDLLRVQEKIIDNRKAFKQKLTSKIQEQIINFIQSVDSSSNNYRIKQLIYQYFGQLESLLHNISVDESLKQRKKAQQNKYLNKINEQKQRQEQIRRERQERQRIKKEQLQRANRIRQERQEQQKIKRQQLLAQASKKRQQEQQKRKRQRQELQRKKQIEKQKRMEAEGEQKKKRQEQRKKLQQDKKRREKQEQQKKRIKLQQQKSEKEKRDQQKKRKEQQQRRKLEERKQLQAQKKRKDEEARKLREQEQKRKKNEEQSKKQRQLQQKRKQQQQRKKQQQELKKKKELEEQNKRQQQENRRKQEEQRKIKEAQTKRKQAQEKKRKQEQKKLKQQQEKKRIAQQKRIQDEKKRKQEQQRKLQEQKRRQQQKKRQEEEKKKQEQQKRRLEQEKKKQEDQKKRKQEERKREEAEKKKRQDDERRRQQQERKKQQQIKRKKQEQQKKIKLELQQKKRKELQEKKKEQQRLKLQEQKRKQQQKKKRQEQERKRKQQQKRLEDQRKLKEAQQAKKKEAAKAGNKKNQPPKKSAIDYGNLQDQLIDEDEDIRKPNKQVQKGNKQNDDDQYLQEYDDDFDDLSPGKDEQQQQIEPKKLIDYDSVKSINDYIKGTSYARKNKPNLELYNNHNQYIYMFEEFIQNRKLFIFDLSISKAIYDFSNQLQDDSIQQDDLKLTLDTIMQAVFEIYSKQLQTPQMDPRTKYILPFSFKNDLGIYLIQLYLEQKEVIIVMKEQIQDQAQQEAYNSIIEALMHTFQFEEPDVRNYVVPEQSKAVLDTFDKQLPNLLILFAMHYEQEYDFVAPMVINQYTIERFFYIAHILQPLYKAIEDDNQAICTFYDQLSKKFVDDEKTKIKFFEADATDPDYETNVSLISNKFKQEFLKDKTTQNYLIMIQVIIPQEESDSVAKVTIYLSLSKAPEKPQLNYYIVTKDEQDEQNLSRMFEFSSGDIDEKFDTTVYMDFTRHNGLTEYSDWTLPLWAHMTQKRKMTPIQAFRALTLGMTPFFVTYKQMD